jgi:hypothetical protein
MLLLLVEHCLVLCVLLHLIASSTVTLLVHLLVNVHVLTVQ